MKVSSFFVISVVSNSLTRVIFRHISTKHIETVLMCYL